MTARQIIEAESPKKAMRMGRNPNEVTVDDVSTHWQPSGTPDYPSHWQAMWTPKFMRAHPEIKGCPLGSYDLRTTTGLYLAINDLVNRTNRESGTNFFIRVAEKR